MLEGTMLVGVRDSRSGQESIFRYIIRKDRSCSILSLSECSRKVDGIGGIIWEGSLLLCEVLKKINKSNCTIIELGCGVGICGLTALRLGHKCIITDREVDLVRENFESLKCTLPDADSATIVELEWGTELMPFSIQESCSPEKVIIGAEITCLINQQGRLIQTIESLYSSSTVILLTFDGGSQPSKYETNFRRILAEKGYLSRTVSSGQVTESEHRPHLPDSNIDELLEPSDGRRTYFYLNEDENVQAHSHEASPYECGKHHIVEMFYKSSAVHICSRCNMEYFNIFNSMTACRFHSGLYVCRKHPAEIRCSIDGLGDGLGYYGNGREGTSNKLIRLHD